MAYKELIHKYTYKKDELGRVTGRRTFITDADGDVLTLPVRGTSKMPNEAGTDITGCLARSIEVVRDPDDNEPQYVVYYDTQSATGASGIQGISADEDSRSFDVSAELMSIDSAAGDWEWDLQGEAIGAGIALFKRAVMVEFSMVKSGLTTTAKNTLLTKIREQAGTINSATFEGYAEGQVYFAGPRGGNYTDEDGVEKWTVELCFTARLLTDEKDFNGDDITQDDWLYLYVDAPDAAGDFDKPKQGTNYLYRKTNFTTLTA